MLTRYKSHCGCSRCLPGKLNNLWYQERQILKKKFDPGSEAWVSKYKQQDASMATNECVNSPAEQSGTFSNNQIFFTWLKSQRKFYLCSLFASRTWKTLFTRWTRGSRVASLSDRTGLSCWTLLCQTSVLALALQQISSETHNHHKELLVSTDILIKCVSAFLLITYEITWGPTTPPGPGGPVLPWKPWN